MKCGAKKYSGSNLQDQKDREHEARILIDDLKGQGFSIEQISKMSGFTRNAARNWEKQAPSKKAITQLRAAHRIVIDEHRS